MTPKRMFFVILIVLILGVAGSGLVYIKAENTLEEKAIEISKLNANVDVEQTRIDRAVAATSRLEELAFIQEIADEILPPTKVQSDIVGEIDAIGRINGISITGINFTATGTNIANPDLTQTRPIKEIPGINALPVTITIQDATYEQLLAFLTSIEQNQRKMQADNIAITPKLNDAGSPTGRFGIVLVINVFVRS